MRSGEKTLDATDVKVGMRLRTRRLMLAMSQEKLAKELKLTFQQVQKYEKGTNRISASRLQQICQILSVPVSYFFDELPSLKKAVTGASASINDVDRFLATSDGLALTKAFMKIESNGTKRMIVALVEEIAATEAMNAQK